MEDNSEGRKDEEGKRKVVGVPRTSSVDFRPGFSSSASSGDGSGSILRHQSWKELRIRDGLWLGEQLEEGPVSEESEEKGEICKSETEETPSMASQEKSDISDSSSEALSNVYSKLSPFNILWAFGLNQNVQIINLTTKDSFEVFYVAAHFGVIYNTGKDTMTFLPGHNYPITSIASDVTGRWLVTADEGEDTVIIIWDRQKKLPVWSLYNVFPKAGVRCVNISQDARFLAAVDSNLNQVKFWLWTYGRDEPDGEFEVEQSAGKAKHINFNHVHTEQFVVTMENTVAFCQWEETRRTLEKHFPKLDSGKKKLGYLRESIFLDDSHTVLSSTSQGYAVVWSDVKYKDVQESGTEGTINKNFLKAIKLHKTGIMSLRLCDGAVATAAEDGIIMFHDQQCRLLYWLSEPQTNSIVSLSFNIDPIHCSADPFALDNVSGQEEIQRVLEYEISLDRRTSDSTEESEETTVEKEDACSEELPYPLDCTLDSKVFFIRDFMILKANGQIGYVSHRREKARYYLTEMEAPILSLDCNPNKCHVVMGNTLGRMTLYDHNKKKKLLSSVFPSAITTLKYSNFGHSIMAGFQNGDLLHLDALLLTVKCKLESSRAALEKLCFSPRDDIVAYYDRSLTVNVLKKKDPTRWTCMGRYVSHYKPIVDILFTTVKENSRMCRLFTIGQDRMLVEYDMKNLEENKLKVLNTIRIEQTAIPLCFTSIDKFYTTPHFLISNDQYKLKLIDTDNFTCKKTTLGPTADTPINLMTVLNEVEASPDRAKMVYSTDKHIGIRLLPPTGNPFEGIGMVAHTTKLINVAVSHDHKYVFTLGVDDMCPLMWEINPTSVEVASQLGGTELEPFVSLIEGGPNSFVFKELEDFFYYAQIIHQGEDPNLDRSVSKKLALCEIPDLFRALGYYPTDYEVNNLLQELKHINYEETHQIREEITFEECVKAFLNHRPVQPTTLTEIHDALLKIADISDPSDIIIERNELYKALEERAEGMDHAEVLGYLCILLLPKDENHPVPHNLSLYRFAEDVLGIDLTITEENVRQITHAFENNTE